MPMDEIVRTLMHGGDLENFPAEIANGLITGRLRIDPDKRWNDSPTFKEMVDIALEFHGTLSGYAEPEGIAFHTVTIKADAPTIERLKKRLGERYPDEITEVSPGVWNLESVVGLV